MWPSSIKSDVDFLHQFNLWLHHYYSFFQCLKKNVFQNFQKLAGLWLVGEVGEVVNHLCFTDLRRPRIARGSNIGLVIEDTTQSYLDGIEIKGILNYSQSD